MGHIAGGIGVDRVQWLQARRRLKLKSWDIGWVEFYCRTALSVCLSMPTISRDLGIYPYGADDIARPPLPVRGGVHPQTTRHPTNQPTTCRYPLRYWKIDTHISIEEDSRSPIIYFYD